MWLPSAAFHICPPSASPEARRLPSGDQATAVTGYLCPLVGVDVVAFEIPHMHRGIPIGVVTEESGGSEAATIGGPGHDVHPCRKRVNFLISMPLVGVDMAAIGGIPHLHGLIS